MTSRVLLTLLAMVTLPSLSACSESKALLASVAAPAAHQDEPLPKALDLDQERTRKLYLIVVGKLRDQGSARAALSYLDAYDRQYPNDPEANLLRADCLVSIGSIDQAEPVYRSLLRTAYQPAANAGLGKVAMARSDWSGAVDGFQAAVALSPSSTEYVNNLAYAQMRAGRYDMALSIMRQASELDPGNILVRNNLILCLHLSGQTAEVQKMLHAISNPAEQRSVTAMLSNAVADKPATLQN